MTTMTPTMTRPLPDHRRQAGQAFGAMIFSFFGTAWLGGACLLAWPAASTVRALALTVVALAGAALFLVALRRRRRLLALPSAAPDPQQERRRARRFHLINAGQWIAALVTINVLNNVGLGTWDLPALIGIVGIHFLLLAPVFHQPRHYIVGTILILAALACPLLGSGPLLAAAPAATGLTLWIAGVWPHSHDCA